MILLITALHCEAKPLVEYFSLKKEERIKKFDTYTGDGITLVISGIGMIKSAAAVSYLAGCISPEEITGAFNIGICGAVSDQIPLGTAVLVNKVIHSDSKRTFYPDILVKHPFMEGSLESFSHPVGAAHVHQIEADFVDMEAAGFMEAVSIFLPAHKVHCIKVVSDHLDISKPDPSFVKGLICQNLSPVHQFLLQIKSLNESQNPLLTAEETQLIQAVSENLKFSVTMKHQLEKLIIQGKMRGLNPYHCLEPFMSIKVPSKREGKQYLERIREMLAE